ncbi:MAG: hypothetical protein HYT89_07280 [Candidatus Omnitrophica bacterium]|nr:hypothetical protein [Candidatus Omnitrophota bacterium]
MADHRKIARVVFLFLACGATAFPAREAAGSWEFAGWHGGGAYPAVVPDPKVRGRVYLLSDVAGLWRSDDRGDYWESKTKGLRNLHCSSLAAFPADTDILYIGTPAGIHQSVDGGASWRALDSTQDKIRSRRRDSYRSLVVDPDDPDKVYAGTLSGEVYFTADGGKTWSPLGARSPLFGSDAPVRAVYLTRDKAHLFAASNNGLRRYDFSGTWAGAGPGKSPVFDMTAHGPTETIYVTDGKRVSWTRDLGATWRSSSGLPLSNGKILRIAVAGGAAGDVRLLAGWGDGWRGGAFLSADGGTTWIDISKNLHHDTAGNPTRAWKKGFTRPLSVAFDAFNPGTLYLSDLWGVWRSDDSGRTWHEKIKGAAMTFSPDGNELYVARYAGSVYKARLR